MLDVGPLIPGRDGGVERGSRFGDGIQAFPFDQLGVAAGAVVRPRSAAAVIAGFDEVERFPAFNAFGGGWRWFYGSVCGGQGFARFRLGFVTILSPASSMTLESVSTFA